MTHWHTPNLTTPEVLLHRIGHLDPIQIQAWQQMQPYERLAVAFSAYQFALEAVRATERAAHPDLSEDALNWRVTRRMQGDSTLGGSGGPGTP